MSHITINDLVKILLTVPDKARSLPIYDIRGCRNGEVGGFQITLQDGKKDRYVLIPHNVGDVMYDSFGERGTKENIRLVQYHEDGGVMIQFQMGKKNPCGCDSSCYHYEFDSDSNKVYGVCNCCGKDIYIVEDINSNEEISKGKWVVK